MKSPVPMCLLRVQDHVNNKKTSGSFVHQGHDNAYSFFSNLKRRTLKAVTKSLDTSCKDE